MDAMRSLIRRGVENGEFRANAVLEFPQLLIAPVFFSMMWTSVFHRQSDLDTDAFIEAYMDIVLHKLCADTP